MHNEYLLTTMCALAIAAAGAIIYAAWMRRCHTMLRAAWREQFDRNEALRMQVAELEVRMRKPDRELGVESDDALVAELFARCDHGMVAMIKQGYGAPTNIALVRRFKGNQHTVAGLAADMMQTMIASVHDSQQPVAEP
jgi:hypothetical protein